MHKSTVEVKIKDNKRLSEILSVKMKELDDCKHHIAELEGSSHEIHELTDRISFM